MGMKLIDKNILIVSVNEKGAMKWNRLAMYLVIKEGMEVTSWMTNAQCVGFKIGLVIEPNKVLVQSLIHWLN